jgi:hypothetical protein
LTALLLVCGVGSIITDILCSGGGGGGGNTIDV